MVGKDVGVLMDHQMSGTKQCDAAFKKDSADGGCINSKHYVQLMGSDSFVLVHFAVLCPVLCPALGY